VSYALEDPEGRGKTVRQMLAERAEEEFAISPLVVLECLAGVIRAGDGRGGALHEQYLSTFAMLPISPEVGAKAAELRAGFALKTRDASASGDCADEWLQRALDERSATGPSGRRLRSRNRLTGNRADGSVAMVRRWYGRTMKLTMDKAGRLVVPKPLREALGLGDGGEVDVTVYGAGLQIVPGGRTARIIEVDGQLVAESDTVITDEMIFGLMDSMRR
jgi:AbrB family looped-hinge helix DNA binding protein